MRKAVITVLLGFWLLSPTVSASTTLRQKIWRSDPCLAWIIDREDPSWNPTVSFNGGHDIYSSYGLPQANPGTKMASAGADWRTNPYTQLRWMRRYVLKYGGSCGAKQFWIGHNWYQMSRTERMFNSNRNRHRHGGKRIPNFVRPEERIEKHRRPMTWFESVQDLFSGRRRRGQQQKEEE